MATGDTRLPEGTDSIIGGASVGNDLSDDTGGTTLSYDEDPAVGTTPRTGTGARTAGSDTGLGGKAAEVRDQAAEKAREYALIGKDRAVEQLDNVQRLISDAADTIESKVGPQYGAYIRQAGTQVGSLTDLIRDKDVDQLIGDARDLVRKSPGIAIGAAATLGFLIARVAKAGLDAASTPASAPGSTPASSSTPADRGTAPSSTSVTPTAGAFTTP